MAMHMEFFKTHPFLVTFIMGIVLAMEGNKEDTDTIRAIKIATMGPLGGIGDAILYLTLLPITAGIGVSMAMNGNIAGPFVFLLLFNAVHFGLRFGLMNYGYTTGVSATEQLGEQTQAFSRAASIVGITVVGALVASYIGLETSIVISPGETEVVLQEVFDEMIPKLLPALYTFAMYKLLKKDFSPVMLILITIVVGIVGKLLGIL